MFGILRTIVDLVRGAVVESSCACLAHRFPFITTCVGCLSGLSSSDLGIMVCIQSEVRSACERRALFGEKRPRSRSQHTCFSAELVLSQAFLLEGRGLHGRFRRMMSTIAGVP